MEKDRKGGIALQNRTTMKNKEKLFYSICILFSILTVFLIVVSKETNVILGSIVWLLFFGVGGICYYVLNRKGSKRIKQEKIVIITDQRRKIIALMIACLCFVIAGYSALPFNHLYDDSDRYTPTFGWIMGSISISFFGFGFVISIIKLVKPRLVVQISTEGLIIPKGIGRRIFFAWKDIQAVRTTDSFLFVYLKNPDLYPANKMLGSINAKLTGTNINIPLTFINHDIEHLENFINRYIEKT